MGDFGGVRPTVEFMEKAKGTLAKALALNDQDVDTHVAMALLAARFDFDWETGERHVRRALELDPNSARAHHQLAQNILVPQSRLEEAIAEQDRAAKLDPSNTGIAAGGPWMLYLKRDFEGARKGFSANSDTMSIGGLGMVLQAMGRHQEALTISYQLQNIFPQPYTLGFIGANRAKMGDVAGARKTLDELTALSKSHYVSPGAFAAIHIALKEHDNAFADLERGRLEHDSPLIFLRVDVIFDPLRKDPRFEKLLEEVGLSDKQIQE